MRKKLQSAIVFNPFMSIERFLDEYRHLAVASFQHKKSIKRFFCKPNCCLAIMRDKNAK